MKILNSTYKIGAAALMAIMALSCEEDAFQLPESEPRIEGSRQFRGIPGEAVRIQLSVTDPVGLKNVSLNYDTWNLNESFSISGETSFELSYELDVPGDAENGSMHALLLQAINSNDVMSTDTVTLVLNGDKEAPSIIPTGANGIHFLVEGPDATLAFEVIDDQQLATVLIVGGSLSEEVTVNSRSFVYNKELNFLQSGIYEFEVTATDADGNSTTETLTLVAQEPFDAMYLADVATDEALVSDLMGVPMLINSSEDTLRAGKAFVANYYNASQDTEIRFIPNKTSFEPFTIGADAEGNLKVAVDAAVTPMVLSDIGYYQITLELEDLSYTIEKYTPEDTVYEYTTVIGTGVKVNGESTCVDNTTELDGTCWHFKSAKRLVKDEINPYLFHAELEIFDYDPSTEGESGFILGANETGWQHFWRFDKEKDPDVTVLNGGSNFRFLDGESGTYLIRFDTHLNRVQVTPKN